MTGRILAIGDIHLGKRPGGIPEHVRQEHPTLSGVIRPDVAWDAAIDHAVDQQVDAVLLAGDVVHKDNDMWRVRSRVAEGFERLREADIPVIAVAGNHDPKALPQIIRTSTHVKLLGASSEWESITLNRRRSSEPLVNVAGWSFSEGHCSTSPMTEFMAARNNFKFADGVPTLGLLHCDLDVANSVYAPVRTDELRRAGFAAWLLGHIHLPSWESLSLSQPIGYLGSLTPLRPTEHGAHGPWMIEISGSSITARQLPMAPLHWAELEVSVDEVLEVDSLSNQIYQTVKRFHEDKLHPNHPDIRGVGLVIRFTGRSKIAEDLRRSLQSGSNQGIRSWVERFGDAVYFVRTAESHFRHHQSLEELSESLTPVGLLAKRLILIRDGEDSDERRQLIDQGRAALQETADDRSWNELGDSDTFHDVDLSEEAVAAHLTESGLDVLEALLDTHRERSDAP